MHIYSRIEAYIEKPEAPANKLAVLLPGYLDHCNYNHLKRLAKDLAREGYLAVRFNPTGTWESGGDISHYFMTQYLQDVEDVINWAEKENGESFGQIVLVGHSFGGQIALQYGLTHKNIVAAIGIMPAFGKFEEDEALLAWRSTGYRESKRKYPSGEAVKEFQVPYSFLMDRQKYLLEDLAGSHCPKLLIAGELDDAVLPAAVRESFEKLAEPKKFVLMESIGHDYRLSVEDIAKVDEVIIDFLDKS